MEKPTNTENQEQDHHQLAGGAISQSVPAARSNYLCTFCKRGFSNAQALGGHMNIHRKHKAKLMIKQPTFSIHETKQAIIKIKILQLLSMSMINLKGNLERIYHRLPAVARRISEILDLELRLGPQPPQDSSSSANMATREFF